MFTNKHILASLTLLTYCTTGYAMKPSLQLEDLSREPFGTRKPLPSFQLLNSMAAPDYKPNKDDEKRLVNIFAPFAKHERPQEDLPKMILAASAYLTLFDAQKEDREAIMNDITEIVEATENYYHDQCAPDKQELDTSDKQKIAQHLLYSPFMYRSETSTLFALTNSQTSLRLQYDELSARLSRINVHLLSVETYAKSMHACVAYMPQELRAQVQAHVTIDELQASFKLAKKLLELNKAKTVERMKSINEAQKTAVERCKSVVGTLQKELANSSDETKTAILTELETAQKQLADETAHSKTLEAELHEITNSGWFTVFGFSNK